jgi:hypothetical protein
MRKYRIEFAIAIAGILLLVLLAFGGRAAREHNVSVYSTYDTGPNGYRALYEVLRGVGVGVGRFQRVLGVLDPSIRTLIVTGYEHDPSAKPLDEHDAAVLRRFVQAGGRLVAIDEEFAGPDDIAPGVGVTVRNGGGDAVALARNGLTDGVGRASGSIAWTFPFKEPRGVPLLANDRGMVAVLYRVGRGDVIAVTAPAIFGNAQLRRADNLRFAYNIIAGHGPAAFDEYVHGYDDDLSLWAALPNAVRAAVLIVVAVVVLGVIGANAPFAPPYLPDAPDERDSSDYITAIAELMRRSRSRPSDTEVMQQATLDFHMRKEHA